MSSPVLGATGENTTSEIDGGELTVSVLLASHATVPRGVRAWPLSVWLPGLSVPS